MSSIAVRDLIEAFLAAELPSEKVIDVTGEFEDIKDVVKDAGLGPSDPWLGLQYVGNDELPVDIAASNTEGKYREFGVIYLHVVDIARLGPKRALLLRAEGIRDKFRGKRIGNLVIKSVSPPQIGLGISLSFEGGYTAAVIDMVYDYDFDL